MESDVLKTTALSFLGKALSLRPVSNAGDEDIGPVQQFRCGIYELVKGVGPSVSAGVHHDKSITPSELSSHLVVTRTGPERFDICSVRYEAELGLCSQASVLHISLKCRRQHINLACASAGPPFEPIQELRQQRSRL